MSQLVQYRYQDSLYSFTLDGWFNATDAATRFGKRLAHWLDNAETLEYIRAFDEVLTGGPSQILNSRNSGYLKTRRGSPARGGGTWLHPKLAVAFARWLDAKFAVWCDLQIDAIIRGQIQAQGSPELIGLYLRPDATPWEKRFPDNYYRALAHVTRTDYSGHTGGTPALFGQLTDRWVYGCILPTDIYEELRTRRDESQKMHQWLTQGGVDLLDKQIHLVATVANTSADLRDFHARMMALPGNRGQLGFIWPMTANANTHESLHMEQTG